MDQEFLRTNPKLSDGFTESGVVHSNHVLTCNECDRIVWGPVDLLGIRPQRDDRIGKLVRSLCEHPGTIYRMVKSCIPNHKSKIKYNIKWQPGYAGFHVHCICNDIWGFHLCAVDTAANLQYVGHIFSSSYRTSVYEMTNKKEINNKSKLAAINAPQSEDEEDASISPSKKASTADLSINLCCGDQPAMEMAARELGVDVKIPMTETEATVLDEACAEADIASNITERTRGTPQVCHLTEVDRKIAYVCEKYTEFYSTIHIVSDPQYDHADHRNQYDRRRTSKTRSSKTHTPCAHNSGTINKSIIHNNMRTYDSNSRRRKPRKQQNNWLPRQ